MGFRAIRSAGIDAPPAATFSSAHFSGMLLAGGDMRSLALHMLGSLEEKGALAALRSAGEAGVLEPLLRACAEEFEAVVSTRPAPPRALSNLDCGSRTLLFLLEPETYKRCPALEPASLRAFGELAGRCCLAAASELEKQRAPPSTAAAPAAAALHSTGGAAAAIAAVVAGAAAAVAEERGCSGRGAPGVSAPPAVLGEVLSFVRLARTCARALLPSNGHLTPETVPIIDAALCAQEGVARALLLTLMLAPRTAVAELASIVLTNLTSEPASKQLPQQLLSCAELLVDAIGSTSQDESVTSRLISTMSNLVSALGEEASAVFVRFGAMRFLQPSLLTEPGRVVLASSLCIAKLSLDATAAMQDINDASALVKNVLHSIVPGAILNSMGLARNEDTLIRDLAGPAVNENALLQLALLHTYSHLITAPEGKGGSAVFAPTLHNRRMMLDSPAALHFLRVCAASGDSFVYTASAFLLRSLGLAVPFFRAPGTTGRGGGAGGGSSGDSDELASPESWSIERVCTWVSQQPFRAYRNAFRDNFINGVMLLELTDRDIQDAGIAPPLHRKAILHALNSLRGEAAAAAAEAAECIGDGGEEGLSDDCGSDAAATVLSPSSSSSRSLSPIAATAAARRSSPSLGSPLAARPRGGKVSGGGVDVFISYRRNGGSDFAQLLKILLSERGRSSFLDVENLGGGDFEDSLVRNLENARTVLLVWSPGCFDRMVVEDPSTSIDFVRKEYLLALKLKKLIVPVRHEHFVFPDASKLPEDVRPILRYNAVHWIGAYRKACTEELLERLGF